MYRVLVFPSCNEPGLEIIHALLKSNKLEVIAGSSIAAEYDPSSVLLRHHLRCPHFREANFAADFRQLLLDHRIDIVFPTVDALVAEFSRWCLAGTTFIATNRETAGIVLSKSRTYECLQEILPVPQTYSRETVSYPAYAKPDVGGGSKGNLLVNGPEDFECAIARGLVVTEYLPGDEFTVDCLNDLSGRLLFANVRLRGRVGCGIALGTKSVTHAQIQEYVRRIASHLRIEGPWFSQFKLAADGRPKLLEINARVAGSMTLSRLMGVNIPLAAVFLFLKYSLEIPRPVGCVVLNRCLKNVSLIDDFTWVVWDLDDTLLRKDGKPDPELMASLFDLHNRGIKQALLTKNPRVKSLLDQHRIPNFFLDIRCADDKEVELRDILRTHGIQEPNCLLINDSMTEKLAFQRHFPGLRIVTPDAIDLLGKEKLA